MLRNLNHKKHLFNELLTAFTTVSGENIGIDEARTLYAYLVSVANAEICQGDSKTAVGG